MAQAREVKTRNKQRGSTLCETLLIIKLLVFAISIILTVSYLSFAKLWMKHSLNEAVICLAKEQAHNHCHRELEKKTSTLLPWGSFKTIKIRKKETQIEGQLKWEIHALNLKKLTFTTKQKIISDRLIPPLLRLRKELL